MTRPGDDLDPPERDEERLTGRIIQTMRRKLEKDWEPAATKRDAHPKLHGLLAATFSIEANLPPELRVGIFAKPAAYQAWVRTSSASARPQPDGVKDVRGLAIKVLDVPGARIPESDEAETQDFLMVSIPSMPLGTVKLFHDAIYYSIRYSPLVFAAKMLLSGHARVLRELAAARIRPSSPLEIRYWSTTPYLFGPGRAAKYSLIPAAGTPTPVPDNPGDDYLTDAMERRLAVGPVAFDFAVQLRVGNMPIADSAVRWDETTSPFVKVATLTIPPQTFRTEERAQMAEALSFSPAHALTEHRPLGSINRARMRVYRTMSEFRHARRGLPRLHS